MIIGDANLSEISTYLKLGTTSLVLSMIEDAFITVDLAVDQPVRTLHEVSHDPDLRQLITLRSGRTLTAVQLQMEYFELARKYVDERYGADADDQTKDVLTRWEDTLNRLETDPMSLSGELDWIAKRELLEGYRRRDGLDWTPPGSTWWTSSTRTYGPTRACTTVWRPAQDQAPPGRGRGHPGPHEAAGGHPRVLPRPLSGAVRRRRGGRFLGLGDLRPARP